MSFFGDMVYRGSQNAWLLVCKSSNEKPCDDLQIDILGSAHLCQDPLDVQKF
jgi:hypothetical protein